MADRHLARAVQGLRRLVAGSAALELSDGQLLTQFATRRDEGAFAELVRRHGPMVLGVCRRVLGNAHDAEDAFQATFLILARKAAGAVRYRSVGGWLHAVAYHVALRERKRTARRKQHERQVGRVAPRETISDLDRRELCQVLDEELQRLPEKYRTPLVLCYLETRSNEEAARVLACPITTLAWRLGRGRELLRGRLLRRGLVLPAAAVEAAVVEQASAALPAALAAAVVKGAVVFTEGSAAASGVSPGAAALAEGVLMSMSLAKLKFAVAIALTVALLLGAVQWTFRGLTAGPPSTTKPEKPRAAARKPVGRIVGFKERKTFKMARRPDKAGDVQFLAFSPDGKRLVEGDSQEARLYDAATGKELAALKGPVPKLTAVIPETGAEAKTLTVSAHFVFGAGAKELAAIDETGVCLWNLEKKKVLADLDIGGYRGGDQPVSFESSAVTCSADGRRAAAGNPDGKVKLWDLTGLWKKKPLRKAEMRTLTGADTAVQALAFSFDAKMVAAVHNKGHVRVWEVATGKKRMAAEGNGQETDMIPYARAAVFGPDGKRLAVADRGGLRLFDVTSGKKLTAFSFGGGPEPPKVISVDDPKPVGRQFYVTTVAFAPGGKAVVVGFNDGQVHVWDLAALWAKTAAAPKRPLAKLRHSPKVAKDDFAQVWAIAFSPDGSSFATGSGNGLIKVWDAVKRR
jgi:RNA polymerase sigma factor (sigma-70 family)